eukprot:gene15352-67097_t
MLSVFPAQNGTQPVGGQAAGGGTAALRDAVRAACRTLCSEEEGCVGVTVEFAPYPTDGAASIDERDGWADLG